MKKKKKKNMKTLTKHPRKAAWILTAAHSWRLVGMPPAAHLPLLLVSLTTAAAAWAAATAASATAAVAAATAMACLLGSAAGASTCWAWWWWLLLLLLSFSSLYDLTKLHRRLCLGGFGDEVGAEAGSCFFRRRSPRNHLDALPIFFFFFREQNDFGFFNALCMWERRRKRMWRSWKEGEGLERGRRRMGCCVREEGEI